jgi:hypothetical protein
MISPDISTVDEMRRVHEEPMQITASAVSWGAILAGAAAAASLSLILLILGTGLGMSSVSPWSYNGVSATTFGVSTIIWLTFTQIFASGTGGYLAGRLRTKWISVHTDEVYFRDTAHGLLAWGIATLATAALLTTVIGSIINGGIQAGASVAGDVASAAVGSEMAKSSKESTPLSYYVDSLFRTDPNSTLAGSGVALDAQQPNSASLAPEVTRIFMNTLRTEPLPAEDVRYVGQLVAKHTGLTQQDAEKRVIDTYSRVQLKIRDTETAARDAADKARKASAYTALWLFVSLLIGAFVASFAATIGGRQREL